MSAKWLELLKEVAPGIRKVAILFKPKVAVLGGAYSLPGELPIQAPTYFELVLNLQDREGDGTRNTARDPVARRRADRMRRREFVLGSVGGALASSVDIARAQPRKVWRIGLITGLARPHSFSTSLLGGFANGMLELGYVEDPAKWRYLPAICSSGQMTTSCRSARWHRGSADANSSPSGGIVFRSIEASAGRMRHGG